jgi:hypothetical protein
LEQFINLDVLSKDEDKLIEVLDSGAMAAFRSGNDFLYVIRNNKEFRLFSHTPGSPGGGTKTFPVDEKHLAMVRKIMSVADAGYLVEFAADMNLIGVMAGAEEGILSMFPGDDRDADGAVEFKIPGEEEDESDEEPTGKTAGES